MTKIALALACICLVVTFAFGQQRQPTAHYVARVIGFLDGTKRTIPIYAMAQVDQNAEATVRSVPHNDLIVYKTPDKQHHPIALIDNALWVYMISVRGPNDPPGKLTHYFATVHPNGEIRHYKLDGDGKGPFQKVAEGEFLPFAFDELASRVPQDYVNRESAGRQK